MATNNMQIEHESFLESFDERRINQLKAQLVQLERQVIILTRSTSGFKEKIHLAGGVLQQTIDFLTPHTDGNSVGNVTIPRSSVTSHIRLLEDMLERVSSSQVGETPAVADMFTPTITFLKTNYTPSIGEISSGTTNHIGLTQVTKLEQRLSGLYGELSAFTNKLQMLPSTKLSSLSSTSYSRLLNTLEKSCEDLLQLSFLVPNVPWSNRYSLPEVSVDGLMKALPKLTYAKQQDVKNLLTSVLKLSEHRYKLLQNKNRNLELDLSHRASQESTSMNHTKSVSEGMLAEFDTYHQSIKESMILPLRGLLEKFSILSNSPTDENLKLFLNDFKEQSPNLVEVCDTIDLHDMNEDGLQHMETHYNKRLQKSLKSLKSQKMELEDEENHDKRIECELRDEVSSRMSQLSTASAASASLSRDGKLRQTVDKKLMPIKDPSRRNIARSKAANSFLSKYDTVEQHSESSSEKPTSSQTSRHFKDGKST